MLVKRWVLSTADCICKASGGFFNNRQVVDAHNALVDNYTELKGQLDIALMENAKGDTSLCERRERIAELVEELRTRTDQRDEFRRQLYLGDKGQRIKELEEKVRCVCRDARTQEDCKEMYLKKAQRLEQQIEGMQQELREWAYNERSVHNLETAEQAMQIAAMQPEPAGSKDVEEKELTKTTEKGSSDAPLRLREDHGMIQWKHDDLTASPGLMATAFLMVRNRLNEVMIVSDDQANFIEMIIKRLEALELK